MRALRSFTVRARLPEALAPLQELAFNLRWSWDNRTRDLFRWVDPQIWELTFHDPVRLLGLVDRQRLDQLAADPAFMGFLHEMHDELGRYLEGPRWFQSQAQSRCAAVAYFSPEFGIAEALPQYSGGLGVLAGDHLKASSSLGVPLIGVGLMYRFGYFRQHLDSDGWQEERYPLLDPHGMALELVDGVRVTVDLAGGPLEAQVWLAQVGRVKLYLLDADVDANEPTTRAVTDRLYGGGTGAPDPSGDPARHRRRPGAGSGRGASPGVPHQRGARRVPRPRADPPADHRRRPVAGPRRSRRCGRGPSSPPTRRYPRESTGSPAS